jgi:hypothetical protein
LNITEYVIPLGEDVRKRHYPEAEKGRMTCFVVQMEVFLHDQWQVVIRYDSAHGFPHVDRYSLGGRKVKETLRLDLNEVLTVADEDIQDNWRTYQRRFLEGVEMSDIFEKHHAILVTEFDRYIVEHPEFAGKIPRNAQVVLQVEGDEDYNMWSRALAERQRDVGQPVVSVSIRGLKPAKSRLLKPVVSRVAMA